MFPFLSSKRGLKKWTFSEFNKKCTLQVRIYIQGGDTSTLVIILIIVMSIYTVYIHQYACIYIYNIAQ